MEGEVREEKWDVHEFGPGVRLHVCPEDDDFGYLEVHREGHHMLGLINKSILVDDIPEKMRNRVDFLADFEKKEENHQNKYSHLSAKISFAPTPNDQAFCDEQNKLWEDEIQKGNVRAVNRTLIETLDPENQGVTIP